MRGTLLRGMMLLLVTASCTLAALGAAEYFRGERHTAQAGEGLAAVRPATAEAATVVVDAGHGGFDGGAVGIETGIKEAGLNLTVAKLLGEALASRGMQVIYTREGEAALADKKDADMAARRTILCDRRADAVVSVHMNKFGDRSVHGAMAYYMQGSAEGELLAQCVIDAVTAAAGQKARAANPGDYFVIRECSAPAVLVECGFLSNAAEERLLQEDAYQRLLAEAVADGVLRYFETRGAGALPPAASPARSAATPPAASPPAPTTTPAAGAKPSAASPAATVSGKAT